MSQLPLELVNSSIGSKVWVVMSNEQEFSGVLEGFDDFVNVVLSDVTEHAQGTETHRSRVLLHGRNVCMLIPGAVGAPGAPKGANIVSV